MGLFHVLPKIFFWFFHSNFGKTFPNFKNTAQKMKFSIKDFFSECDQIFNGNLHFLCSERAFLRTVLRGILVFRWNNVVRSQIRTTITQSRSDVHTKTSKLQRWLNVGEQVQIMMYYIASTLLQHCDRQILNVFPIVDNTTSNLECCANVASKLDKFTSQYITNVSNLRI